MTLLDLLRIWALLALFAFVYVRIVLAMVPR